MTSLYVTPRLSAVNVSARVSRIWIGATMLDGYPLALLMGRFAEGDSRGAQWNTKAQTGVDHDDIDRPEYLLGASESQEDALSPVREEAVRADCETQARESDAHSARAAGLIHRDTQGRSSHHSFFVGGGLVDFPSLPGSYVDSEAVNELLFSLLRSSLVSSRLERTLLAYQYSGFRLANLSTFKCGVNRTVDAQGFDLYWGAGYTPDWMIWNRQPCNNCYDYANYQLTDTYSQPGVGGGKHFRGYSCKEVTYAAQLDGLRPAPTLKTLGPGQGWYVALFLGKVGTEDDFHWVKQDSSGCWSHKLGSAMPSDLDSKWNKIKFPQNAAFSYHNGLINYPTFCGFFRTHAAVIIRGLDPPGCPPVY
jgi:hypothetical protein